MKLSGTSPDKQGRYTDIWRGEANGCPMFVKVFRVPRSDFDDMKRVCDVFDQSDHRLNTISGSILKS